jgi:hypothetical protein
MMVVFSQVIFSLGLMECHVRDLSQKRSLDYTWLGLRESSRVKFDLWNQCISPISTQQGLHDTTFAIRKNGGFL